jgi:hypothetical protein
MRGTCSLETVGKIENFLNTFNTFSGNQKMPLSSSKQTFKIISSKPARVGLVFIIAGYYFCNGGTKYVVLPSPLTLTSQENTRYPTIVNGLPSLSSKSKYRIATHRAAI